MSTAQRHTLEWYLESDEVADSYDELFNTVANAFDAGDAVQLETSGTSTSYLYQRDDGTYLYWCDPRDETAQVHGFDSFADHPSLQLFCMTAERFEQVPVEETKLYHSARGLKEPQKVFGTKA